MALASTTVWEVRTTGNDLNGGGFDSASPGFDYTLQDGPQVNVTDLVTNGTSTVTSASGLFTSAMVGNSMYIASGTGGIVPDVYRIVSYTNSTTVVLDRSTGLTSGTGATCRVGGALASPGRAGALKQGTHRVFQKAGAYSISVATANVPNGMVNLIGSGTAALPGWWVGYDTNRTVGNMDTTLPVITSTVTSGVMLLMDVGHFLLRNITLNIVGTSFGVRSSRNTSLTDRCVINGDGGGRGVGITLFWTNNGYLSNCRFSNLGTAINGGALVQSSLIENCNTAIDGQGSGASASGVVSVNCGQGLISMMVADNCTVFGGGTIGPGIGGGSQISRFTNCVVDSVSGYAFAQGGGHTILQNCAHRNATSGRFAASALIDDRNPVTLTADPFVNAAAGDFRLNDVAGGGALLKGTGWPQTLPVL